MAKTEPQGTSRLMWELNGAGTVERLDILERALWTAYQQGAADTERRMQELN